MSELVFFALGAILGACVNFFSYTPSLNFIAQTLSNKKKYEKIIAGYQQVIEGYKKIKSPLNK